MHPKRAKRLNCKSVSRVCRNLVTCLSVSMDGTLLLSGSHDETVRMWDVQSKQCIRCINHKGEFHPLLWQHLSLFPAF